MQYLHERRKDLGGYLPSRRTQAEPLHTPPREFFQDAYRGSEGHPVSTTKAFGEFLKRLMQDKQLGKCIVPIIPDEARTFGLDALFKPFGIYSNVGQLYEPFDAKTLKAYREAKNGQILEEGITEAGSMSSFIAAGTSYSSHGIPMIPFFIYYSMFGFQRVGDLIWAAGDMRTRGFLLGGTAGRTTLMGEGLQHEDGHSHIAAATVPNMVAYDPAFAYELALILQDGMRRMYEAREDIFYYITLYNEDYPMPAMPAGVEEGVLRGLYRLREAQSKPKAKTPKVHLFGSGTILRETMRAQELLAERFGVMADVWSVTSYKELRRDALEAERWNMLHPTATPKQSYLEQTLAKEQGLFIAASDYVKLLPDMIGRWVPGGLYSLGTDGFGRSENRSSLRRFFEVDAESIVVATLSQLARRGELKPAQVQKAMQELKVDPEKADPVRA